MKQTEPVALVTGASSGFGLLTAVALARRGYRTIATMRNPENSTDLLKKAAAAGVEEAIVVLPMDVTDQAQIHQTVSAVLQAYGRIDVLINNAGFAAGGFVEDVPMDIWRKQIETNVFGVIAVTKAVLPAMRQRGSGCIVNIGSVAGRIAFPGYGPYSTSKFALEGFSEALRLEMKPFGVRVVLLEPGPYRTDIWQKGFGSMSGRADSPYRHALQRVLRYSKKAAETAPDPAQVADRIVQIVESARPKLRYLLGWSPALSLMGKALLPWRWYEYIVERLMR
ncbi:SDR family oxidoreductase [Paenibacillus sp. y28]|uniref:SDR family oxidoreductase n=1 Tax=Paenibacillus sp. y28 TaxID=3129110 RepID=UPI003017E7DA